MWICLPIFLFLLPVLFSWSQNLFCKYKKLPPGPTRWPIIGSLPQMMMIDTVYPYKQFMALAKKYGPIMSLGFGVHYVVLVNSYEVMKDVFKRSETNMERNVSTFVEQRNKGQNAGIIWGHGQVWKEMRKFTVKGLRDFGFGKATSMVEKYNEEVDILIDYIRKEISNTGGIWAVKSHRLSIVATNVLWSSVGGYRFDENSDIIRENMQLSSEVLEIIGPGNLLDIFPFLKIFPNMSGYNRQGLVIERSRNFTKGLIEDAKLKRAGRIEPESFVEVFLDEIEKNKANPQSLMTEEQLLMILMDLFLAGSETASTVLNWIILYVALFPDVQNKIRQEICSVSENWTKMISVTESSRLPYLRCCIYETMRHSPFGPTTLPRRVTADLLYAGYTIPKGTFLSANLYSMFHDKEVWGEDVEEFNPDRFLNFARDGIDLKKLEKVPQFGLGSRMCPGDTIAMNTISAVAHGILSNFVIGIVEGQEPKLEPSTPSITTSPKPYVVTMQPLGRSSINVN